MMKGGSSVIKITGTSEEIYILKQLMLRRLLNDTVEANMASTMSGSKFEATILGRKINVEIDDTPGR